MRNLGVRGISQPATVDVGEGEVDEVDQEDANGDAQLVQRDKHAALLLRGDLGDVDALGDGGERDGEAKDEAADEEEPVAGAVFHSLVKSGRLWTECS